MRRASALRRSILDSCAAGALASTLAASAQSPPSATQDPGRFRLGPVWLTPKIVLRNAGVDSNVFNDADPAVSDRSMALTPSLEAYLPVGSRIRLKTTGALGLNYFQRETSERSTDLNGTGQVELDLGPLTLFATGSALRARQRFSVEVDQRFDRTSRQLGFGARLRFSSSARLSLDLSSGIGTFRHEDGVLVSGDSVKGALDRRSETLGAQLRYALSKRSALRAGVDVIDDRFLESQPGRPDTARSYRYTTGLSFSPGGGLTGEVSLGWRRFPAAGDQAAPSFDGAFLAVQIGMRVSDRAALSLRASRDVNYAVARASVEGAPQRNSYVAGLYGAELQLALPLSLIARPSLAFERASYVLPYGSLDREDRVRSVGFGLLRAFGSSFRMGGAWEWARRTSNAAGLEYDRLTYGITAELTP